MKVAIKMNNQIKRVLLTDGQQRKTLNTARSLGKKGYEVYICEVTRFNPSAFSKYIKGFKKCPDPSIESKLFVQWLIDIIVKLNIDLVIPMDDGSMEIVVNSHEVLSELCLLAIPPVESYKELSDKSNQIRLVEKSETLAPMTWIISDLNQLRQFEDFSDYPLLIKPKKSGGSRGIRKVDSYDELYSAYMEIHELYEFPMIQSFVPLGPRVDVCLLYDMHGDPVAGFVQEEIRHFPIEMGPSTIQRSIIDKELMDATIKLLEPIKWSGIIEVEYMLDVATGRFYFMEINTRFWASLYTAMISGVDFPNLLMKTLKCEAFDPIFNYKEGLYGRWLLPGDIMHFILNRNRFKMRPRFLSGRGSNVYDDIISGEDPLPTLGFILAVLRYVFDIKMWKLFFKR